MKIRTRKYPSLSSPSLSSPRGHRRWGSPWLQVVSQSLWSGKRGLPDTQTHGHTALREGQRGLLTCCVRPRSLCRWDPRPRLVLWVNGSLNKLPLYCAHSDQRCQWMQDHDFATRNPGAHLQGALRHPQFKSLDCCDFLEPGLLPSQLSWSHALCLKKQLRRLYVFAFRPGDQVHGTHSFNPLKPKALKPKPSKNQVHMVFRAAP